MQSDCAADVFPIDRARVNDQLASALAFFSWLEHEDHVTWQFPPRAIENMASSQEHGRMRVMSAGMHVAGMPRTVGQTGFLLSHGNTVHVSTQKHGRRPAIALDMRDHPGLGNARLEGDPRGC
ncbi:MAG: hypothetical protein A2519_22640 [Candidatus Raymondbacteria bacterium RIFOXYD12_FULL_49_13]|uniref:Uncharacterized protein n=1 Tax=Candidatus Raymondbacteria bacterium RIFOXYD12_FULL_49_13 TaxID=1817890 RepID=A0A1F7FHV3_UNCRA|nr:MAG: hypothetical protein A2519_22640 [Candidatus Raymondbacteria bacterium RIFOXYD12_FULL_49_13]